MMITSGAGNRQLDNRERKPWETSVGQRLLEDYADNLLAMHVKRLEAELAEVREQYRAMKRDIVRISNN